MSLAYPLRESLHSLSSNPLRSGLSIVGVVFGVASVVAMLSIGLGAEAEIERLLDALGARNIHITADELEEADWNRVLRSTTGLSTRDLGVVRSLLQDEDGTVFAWAGAWHAGDASLPLIGARLDVYGVTPNFRDVLGAKLLHGRSFTPREDQLAQPVCLLGEELAKSWFGDPAKAVGELVRVERSWFRVVGVLAAGDVAPASQQAAGSSEASVDTEAAGTGAARYAAGAAPGAAEGEGLAATPKTVGGTSSEGSVGGIRLLDLARAVLLPYASAEQRLGPQSALAPLERIIIKLPAEVDPVAARGRVERTLSRLHRNAKVVTVTAADEVIEQKRSTTRLFSYFLMTIALISLVVGGIGIANVMLAGMVERIREVGLRRAIGAKRRHILWQFLTEALTICLLGGLVGGFVGMGVSLVIGQVTGWNVAFPWWGHAVAVAIATIVGIGSGLYPAILASRISPIEALQGRA
jgi:putative ABC transport system permease protein